jgi:hypothetical protein
LDVSTPKLESREEEIANTESPGKAEEAVIAPDVVRKSFVVNPVNLA